nr:phage major capsid protein [Corynebacterium lactis]
MTVHITPGMPEALSPDTTVVHAYTALRDALVNKVGTLLGSDDLSDRAKLKVPYVDELETLNWVAEGEEIQETKTNLKQLEVPSRKLATLKTVSNEAATNSQGQVTTDLLVTQSTRSIVAKADAALFGEQESEGGLVGLSALKGITDAGTLGTNLDPFVDAVAQIVSEGGTEDMIRIICHPKAWAQIAKLKDSSTGNRPLVDALTASTPFLIPNTQGVADVSGMVNTTGITETVRTLNGVPLFMSPHVAENTILVVDAPNIGVGASPVKFTLSEHAAFSRDSVTMRTTFRLGWNVFKPSRIVKIATV